MVNEPVCAPSGSTSVANASRSALSVSGRLMSFMITPTGGSVVCKEGNCSYFAHYTHAAEAS